ncbi:MAG TPA: BrnT family toxin [Thermoanaerobaculia bacterium]
MLVARLDPSEWEGCDWDDGNIGKNWPKHRVTDWEIEEVFLNVPIAFGFDASHSSTDARSFALGQTSRGRWLFVAFTVRGRLVRPISARDMNARERRSYETLKEDPQIQG